MTKQDLIERVIQSAARQKGLPPQMTKKMVGQLVDVVFGEIGGYFVRARVTRKDNPRFTYPGFGTFTKKRREGRTGRDPRSGEPIEIPARVTLAFAPGQGLKSQLNKK
ncbi:MAG: HU family DNA-binding protein [Myxococcales bacterium]|nr:HU family DNA-binding protein [Myxococcales bacterium]